MSEVVGVAVADGNVKTINFTDAEGNDITELIINQLKQFNKNEIKQFLVDNDLNKNAERKERKTSEKWSEKYDVLVENHITHRALKNHPVILVECFREKKPDQKEAVKDNFYIKKINKTDHRLDGIWVKFNSLNKCKDWLNLFRCGDWLEKLRLNYF